MRRRCSGTSVGRYMMIPTQLNTGSGGLWEWAGLMSDRLAAVHLCSMGAGAGMLYASMSPNRSLT